MAEINLDETIKDFNEDYESNPNAVKKGIAIFKNSAVEYMPYDEGIVSFIAKVPDENSTVNHTVKIQLYRGNGSFVDGNCTCRPNRVSKLLCKHIVAATLTLQNEKNKAAVISIIPYERKYRDDMLYCYLAAKDAIGSYAPAEWRKPNLRDDLLDIEKNYFERGDIFYLAISTNDRVVGMAGTQAESNTDLWLKRLFIKPELKGNGIGSRLLEAVEKYAAEKGYTTLHTRFADWYREAAAFYPAKGFIETSTTTPKDYLRYMVKRLK